MITSFKDTPVKLAGRSVHATEASFSENITTASYGAYGVLGAPYIYNEGPVEGAANAQFYLTDNADLETFTGLAKSSVAQELYIGKYKMSQAYIKSVSVAVSPGSVIQVNTTWDYYGAATAQTTTGQYGPILPAIAESVEIAGYENLGGGSSAEVSTINYNFSQNYNPYYFVGGMDSPSVVWVAGEETLEVEGYKITDTLLTAGNPCPALQSPIYLTLKNCSGSSLANISLAGYSTERTVDTAANAVLANGVSLRKTL